MTQILAEPRRPLTRRDRMRAPVLTIGGLALLTVALHVRDPHEGGSWGICPVAAVGFACPGCGALRAVNDLTHGQVGAAASSNLALLIAMPFLVAWLALWAVDRWRGVERVVPARTKRVALIALVAGLAVFTVARNLPMGAWLAP